MKTVICDVCNKTFRRKHHLQKACSTECVKEKAKRYRQSDEFKEYLKKYQQSESYKRSQKKYQQTEGYKKARRKYEKSEKGKAAIKKHQSSEKYKLSMKRYHSSEKGVAARKIFQQTDSFKKSQKKYQQTEGFKKSQNKYFKSERGKAAKKKYLSSDKGQKVIKKHNKIHHERIKNDPILKAKALQSVKDYYKTERGKISAAAVKSRRRNGLKLAEPSWNDRKLVKKIFKIRNYLIKRDNIKYDVDHIIPIQGKTKQGSPVSGLHVWYNLIPIKALSNMKKKTKVPPDKKIHRLPKPDLWIKYLEDKFNLPRKIK